MGDDVPVCVWGRIEMVLGWQKQQTPGKLGKSIFVLSNQNTRNITQNLKLICNNECNSFGASDE